MACGWSKINFGWKSKLHFLAHNYPTKSRPWRAKIEYCSKNRQLLTLWIQNDSKLIFVFKMFIICWKIETLLFGPKWQKMEPSSLILKFVLKSKLHFLTQNDKKSSQHSQTVAWKISIQTVCSEYKSWFVPNSRQICSEQVIFCFEHIVPNRLPSLYQNLRYPYKSWRMTFPEKVLGSLFLLIYGVKYICNPFDFEISEIY